jgi:dihydrofolate reductase
MMRSLTYFVATSLDGFIAAPDGSFDGFPMSGDHIDALVRDYPETLPGAALAALGVKAAHATFDTVLMGWNTYAVGYDQGQSDPYPHLRSFVFTRAHGVREPHPNVAVTEEHPVAVVKRIKAEPSSKDIWLCGGATLASELASEIDRLVLKVNPVVLGAGIGLFAQRPYAPQSFTLQHTRAFQTGVVWNSYVRAAR